MRFRFMLYDKDGRGHCRVRHYRRDGDTVFVPLTRGYEAAIDAADFWKVARYSWAVLKTKRDRTAYARAKYKSKSVELHRYILDAAPGTQIDHENGDGLDCRRGNMRYATRRQNNQNQNVRRDNTSGYKGVSRRDAVGKWAARITYGGRLVYLGQFDTPEQAARAYDAAATEQFGEFARLNFPTEAAS